MTCSVCIQYVSSVRMMVTPVMMMFQVMTILTLFLHYNFFKQNNYYIIFSYCPHYGRANRISGGQLIFISTSPAGQLQFLLKFYPCSTRTHYPNSQPTNLSSYSLKLCALQRGSNYQFYSICFDLIKPRIHNLQHQRRKH